MTRKTKITVAKPALANGLSRKNAPQSVRSVRELRAKANAKQASTKKSTGAKIVTKAKAKASNTITSVEIAKEYKMNAKTLRARIRRNLDDWKSLFVKGERHVFADNKTTRAKIKSLLS